MQFVLYHRFVAVENKKFANKAEMKTNFHNFVTLFWLIIFLFKTNVCAVLCLSQGAEDGFIWKRFILVTVLYALDISIVCPQKGLQFEIIFVFV